MLRIQSYLFFLCITLGLLFNMNIDAQNSEVVKELNYTGTIIPVPENCTAKSPHELIGCDGLTIQWLYMTESMLQDIVWNYITQLENKVNLVDKAELTLISKGQKFRTFKFKLSTKEGYKYRFISFGLIEKQALILNFTTKKDLRNNSDISPFLRQFISFP